MSWIEEMTTAVAAAAELDPAELSLSESTAEEILDLARIASHDSGERINAPLLCYEIGLAVGKGAQLQDIAAAIRAHADATA